MASSLYSVCLVCIPGSIVLLTLSVHPPEAILLLALLSFVVIVGLSPWRNIAIVARTFDSPYVERRLETQVLAIVSSFHRVLLIENERYPSPEHRYTVLTLPAVLAASMWLTFMAWFDGAGLLKALFAGVPLLGLSADPLLHPRREALGHAT